MGTLAYDPERLAQLASALGSVADALALLNSADPEAQPALAVADAASAALDAWRLTALGVAGCAVLTDYRPVALDASDLALATEYVLAALYGWRTVTDPTGSAWTVPPAMEAAAIGHLISTGRITLDTPEQIVLLQARLDTVLVDPAARAAFASNLTAAGAAALADQLAGDRAAALAPVLDDTTAMPVLPDDIGAQVAAIDAVLDHLAGTIVDPNEPLGSARDFLSLMRPYAAALVIAQMNAPSAVIGELAVETMSRYVDSFGVVADEPLTWEMPDSRYLGIGDILYPKVAADDAIVANDVVHRLMDLNPATLLHTVRYPTSTTNLIVRATDPAVIDITTAGTTVRRYLDFMLMPTPNVSIPSSHYTAMGSWDAQRGELAPIIAPWLLQFTSRASEWGWSDEEADEMLGWVIDDDAVLGDLLAHAGRWSDGAVLADPGDDPDVVAENLKDAAKMFGELQAFLEKYAIDDARARQAMFDFTVQLIPMAVGRVIGLFPIGKVPGTIIVKGTPYAVGYLADEAQERELFGSPPPLDEVLQGIALASDHSVAIAAYLALGAMTDALIADGALPADAPWPPPPPDLAGGCPSKDYLEQAQGWLIDQHPDDPLTRTTLELAMLRFANEAGTEKSCQEQQFSGAAD